MDKESWASLAGDHDLTIVRANWDTFTGDVIACVWADDDHDEMANANLIAAAPSLFEAAETAIKAIRPLADQGEDYIWRPAVRAMDALTAALARARGEQP